MHLYVIESAYVLDYEVLSNVGASEAAVSTKALFRLVLTFAIRSLPADPL